MESEVHRLRAEVKRQLLLGKDDKPEGPGIVTVQDFGVGYLTLLQSLDRQLADWRQNSEASVSANVSLQDPSLVWKLCSLSGPYPCFLDAEFARKRIQSFYKLPQGPSKTYTDDIWRNPKLFSWLNDDKPSLLLVKGNFDSTARVAAFGAELADHIADHEPLAYVSCAPIVQRSCALPFRFDAAQVLRHLAIQTLLNTRQPLSIQFLMDALNKFASANCPEEWFKTLESLITGMPRLCIILHLGTQDVGEDIQDWAQRFRSILERLSTRSAQSVVKVMIISCRLLGPAKTIPTISVSQPTLSSEHIRALPSHRAVIPRSLMELRGAKIDNIQAGDDSLVFQSLTERPAESNDAKAPTPSFSTAKGAIQPNDRQDFKIAIFCALSREADAVIALFDRHYDRKAYGKGACDLNSYTLGAIGSHNVIVVHLPGMGKTAAANAATSCRISFTGIKLALIVGICGGVPFGPGQVERILGDVVISDGLVQYDFGRKFPDQFVRKSTFHDALGRPNTEVRSFLARLSGRQSRNELHDAMQTHLKALRTHNGFSDKAAYQYPGIFADVLHEPSYLHKHRDALACTAWAQTCGIDKACDIAKMSSCGTLACSPSSLVPRQRLRQPLANQSQQRAVFPVVHIGTMACGDTVMKSGEDRDRLARDDEIIAFEMEGAGVWEHFPCLILKGICDYADCHKSKNWQDYATATAAACMKAILEQWD